METFPSQLVALPATRPATKSAAKAYDTSIKQLLGQLDSRLSEIQDAVSRNSEALLESIDPGMYTLGYLTVLDGILSLADPLASISQGVLLDKIVEFILHFDPIQIRYGGRPLLSLLENIGSGKLFPPATAVELLSTAILRLDPSGSFFTSTHLLLAKLAYASNTVEPALKILDCDILFYPNMGSSRDGKLLCDPTLPPASYITTQTGLTDNIKPSTVLEYDHLRGIIYMSMGMWSKSLAAFEKVISHPTKDRGVSKIMADSHKRWVLVGLLSHGKPPTMPSYTSGSANAVYKTTGKLYNNVAEAFSSAGAEKLKSEIEENTAIWETDGTSSLIAEILSAYQKWKIIGLRQVYQRVGISQVREMTLNAQTGKPLEDDQQVLTLAREMIGSGMLDGRLEQDGNENYISFRDEGNMVSEAAFATQIAQIHYTIDLLGKQYQQTNDRLSGSKEYVKHLVREQKRAEKDNVDAGIGFDSQIEDEDLMAGIVPHG